MAQDDSILKEPTSARIIKTEHGLAVTVPIDMLVSVGFKEGDVVNLYACRGRIEVTNLSERRYDVEKMVAQITEENLHEHIDSGPPVGRQLW